MPDALPLTRQLLPSLDANTEAALQESIRRFGVLVPVVKDQHGRILDGRNRARIADELGVSYRTDVVTVADDAEADEIQRTLNLDRRHLTADQRREVVAALREAGHSLRAIAGAVGISESGIRKDMAQLRTSAQLEEPDRIVGRSGKSYPATRSLLSTPLPEPHKTPSPLSESISLEEWTQLGEKEREELLAAAPKDGPHFNRQESADIEWAQWSWNPVIGCKHSCPYCYARDIALSARVSRFYPHGFEPAIRPASLSAPSRQKPPREADTDARFRNVFTCSMADLFGRWVPAAWIDAVLDAARNAPYWNFLFLTKFPQRMAEFDLPWNTWLGTTVDLQSRIVNAERAFERIEAPVRWLSIEPMLEDLEFKRLDLFDWIVIGGASPSSKTPVWRPPFAWIRHLLDQIRDAENRRGKAIAVYAKTNLLGATDRDDLLNLPLGLPVPKIETRVPDVFNYLSQEPTR